MILQALNQYYERKVALGDGEIAPFGFEYKSIPVIIEIDIYGNFSQCIVRDEKTSRCEGVGAVFRETSQQY